MFSNLFVMMSLTGSLIFILYMLTYPLSGKYFSLKWRYGVLKMAVAFYILPVSICKYLFINAIHFFFPELWKKASNISGIVKMEYIITIGNDFVKVSSGVRCILLVVVFAGTISVVILHRRMIQYRKWKKLHILGVQNTKDWEHELFIKVKQEMGIKKKVEIVCSKYCRSPLVSGVFSSVLIVPIWSRELGEENFEYMIKHEMVHIKHHDLLIK